MSKETKSNKRVLKGVVSSNKGDKTIVVSVKRSVRHPLYSKSYSVTKKYHAHDEKNEVNIGDTVQIIECVPISKNKRWNLESIVEKTKELES